MNFSQEEKLILFVIFEMILFLLWLFNKTISIFPAFSRIFPASDAPVSANLELELFAEGNLV